MLTPEEAAAVLRRAVELDTPSLEQHDALEESALREAAREVGLSDAAVEQAVAELRSGALAELPPLTPDRRLGLVATVEAGGQVPLPPDRARAALEDWLRGQWFECRRVRGTETEWAPRRGLLAQARRATDVLGDLRLRPVDRLRLCVAPAADGSRVRLVADVSSTRSGLLVGLVGVPAAVVGTGVGLAMGLSGDAGLDVLAALPAAAGAGGLGWLGARSSLDTRRAELAEELERALLAVTSPRVVDRKRLPDRAIAWARQRTR